MAGARLPSGTITFLFTDIEGSTKLLHELGAKRYAQALAEHRRLLRDAFVRHGGVEVDTQGDAFFFAFPTAPGALAAASEGQQALSPGPVRIRMGIHTGTPHLTEEGYVGHDVHRAARIAAAGHGGQIVVSSATAALVEARALRDLGEHRLKDLSAPEHIFQLGEQDFPPLKSLYRTNLPVPSTPFLGRERELADVSSELEREEVRLLTLTGAGGTGKTRLALQAAAEVSEDYADGVWWVPLASLRDPQLVLGEASRVLESRNGLAAHIADRSLLMLLDNFEHLVEAAPALADLLATCPNLKLMVTSREALHLAAEREYVVPPLEEVEALHLFQERAFGAQPDETVVTICQRLDCLPLAVELAAARTKALSAQQILERLEHRLPLLTGGPRDAPERQKTLRATIEWSFSLLDEDEQRLFTRLAVFSGGCTLEAAEQVVDADLDTLQSLVEKSLLRHSDERYWMLETIREYAAETLERSGEGGFLAGRQAAFFAALMDTALLSLHGPEESRARERVIPEAANVVAAIEWTRERDEHELVLRLAIGGEVLVVLPPRQQVIWLDEALRGSTGLPTALLARAYRSAGGVHFILDEFDEARASFLKSASLYRELGDAEEEAMVLRMLSPALCELGEVEEGRASLERALELVEQSGSGRSYAILHHLGELEREYGDPDRAAEYLEESSETARRHGDLMDSANALHGLGDLLLSKHDPTGAEERYAEALALSFDLKSRRGCLYCLRGLAATAALRAEAARAGRLWGSADALERESGYRVTARTYAQYEAALAAVAGPAFDAAADEGRKMTLSEAVAYALAPRA